MALSPASWGTGGGGGGVPAGNDGEIQFNDAGAFGADPNFVWDNFGGGGTLKLIADENGTANIEANGLGTQIQLSAADGDATHVGGEIGITAGASAGNNGGEVSISAGDDDSDDGSGGGLALDSGRSAVNDGGDINIRANGTAQAGNRGGDVNVHAGNGAVHGGNLVLQAGPSDGNVQMYAGDTSQAIQLDNTGLNVLATKVGFFGVAPVVQPAAPVTIFDVIAALKALGLVAT